jgi:hypothetical protein
MNIASSPDAMSPVEMLVPQLLSSVPLVTLIFPNAMDTATALASSSTAGAVSPAVMPVSPTSLGSPAPLSAQIKSNLSDQIRYRRTSEAFVYLTRTQWECNQWQGTGSWFITKPWFGFTIIALSSLLFRAACLPYDTDNSLFRGVQQPFPRTSHRLWGTILPLEERKKYVKSITNTYCILPREICWGIICIYFIIILFHIWINDFEYISACFSAYICTNYF